MKAQLSISRSSQGYINLEIVDCASRVEFVAIRITYEDFAKCVTGLGCQPAEMEVRRLECVGKKKINEKRSIVYPHQNEYRREVLEQWLERNAKEEGWEVNAYLGSQSSVQTKDGKTVLYYSVTKFI